MNEQLARYMLMASDADKMLRDEWPISQAEVAARFGRSQPWLSRLLKWYRRIDAEIAAQSTSDADVIASDGLHEGHDDDEGEARD